VDRLGLRPRFAAALAGGGLAAAVALGGPWAFAPQLPWLSEAFAFLAGGVVAGLVFARRVRRRRREEIDRFHAVLAAGGIGSWALDPETGRIEVDEHAAAMFGLRGGAAELRTFMGRVHLDDRADVQAALLRTLEGRGGYNVAFRTCLPDGRVRHIVAHGAFLPARRRVVGIDLDVTDMRRIEGDLRASNDRSSRIVEEAPLPILLHTEDGAILSVNREWTRQSGYAAEELRTLADWVERAFPDGDPDGFEQLRALFHGAAPVDHGRRCIRTRSGEERIWLLRSASLGPLPDGQQAVMTAAIDVTDQDFARELERSNRDLEHFAYVASHDLQEPLRMVSSYVQLLARRYRGQLDEQADQFIHYAVDGTQRMQGLITDLLAYSRAGRTPTSSEPVDANALVQEVLEVFETRLAEVGAQVSVDPLPVLRGSRSQLRAVFQNLVENAVKYRGPAPLRLHVGVDHTSRPPAITVADNGLGFDPSDAERVFQPFQRLHGRDHSPGNGIGLSIVARIVEGNGGAIRAESRPGEGATFFVQLPWADEAAVRADEEKPEPPVAVADAPRGPVGSGRAAHGPEPGPSGRD